MTSFLKDSLKHSESCPTLLLVAGVDMSCLWWANSDHNLDSHHAPYLVMVVCLFEFE